MAQRVLTWLHSHNISITHWIIGILGVAFIRNFFEVFSSPSYLSFIPLDASTVIHYTFFYFAAILLLMCIARIFGGKTTKAQNVVLFGVPIIWLPPIIDLITTGGTGSRIAYLFSGVPDLFTDFFTFFGPLKTPGITLGIRIELVLILLALGWYVYHCSKNIRKTILAVVCAYVGLFILLSLPSVLMLVENASTRELSSELRQHMLGAGTHIYTNSIHPSTGAHYELREFEIAFNKLMTQWLFIITTALIYFWFRLTQKERLKTVLHNGRWERVCMYVSLLILGMLITAENPVGADWVAVVCLMISWACAFIYAVHVNDVYDIKIDTITNPNRPLIQKTLSVAQMKEYGIIFLLLSLIGAWAASIYSFYFLIIFTVAYYIYSAPPLRLKGVPILSSFLISLAYLSTILSGFFFLSSDKTLTAFSPLIAFGIIIIVTLASNVRDVKDIEGDRKAGILTLPVILKEKGVWITGILFGASLLLIPFFLSYKALYWVAIPCALFGYWAVIRKPYKEKYVFLSYFVFFFVGVFIHFLIN